MRKLYFLLPGLRGRYACGGLWAELKTQQMAQEICETAIVTYRQREPDALFLADLLQDSSQAALTLGTGISVINWGFDVPELVKKLHPYPTVYHAHSSAYGFRLPPQIPIITVSRNTLGYWGQWASTALLYYLPNEISPEFQNQHLPQREIDVLVQVRKSSSYLLNTLVPALQPHCRVEVVKGYVEDLPKLFNQTKVYLYDSAEYWAVTGVTEGFGLQPLEAMACGCQVFSSINHGLSDYLDPGFNSHKIAGYALGYDLQRILAIVRNYTPPPLTETDLAEYRKPQILQRLHVILTEINQYFDYLQTNKPQPKTIAPLTSARIFALRWRQKFEKIRKILGLSP
ncbi:MAG: glycosyltransferase [Prochlorotrichaceae cyanobacterium]